MNEDLTLENYPEAVKAVMRKARGDKAGAASGAAKRLAATLSISNQAARALVKGTLAHGRVLLKPNLSAKVDSATWFMVFSLINGGYSKTVWGVFRKALAEVYARQCQAEKA